MIPSYYQKVNSGFGTQRFLVSLVCQSVVILSRPVQFRTIYFMTLTGRQLSWWPVFSWARTAVSDEIRKPVISSGLFSSRSDLLACGGALASARTFFGG